MYRHLFNLFLTTALLPLISLRADPSAPGVSIDHPESKWRILMTAEGYSDVAFDKRGGFVDREYLSGEWAAAIHYEGGSNPEEAIWFRKVFAFPCWETNSNFEVTQPMTVDTPNVNVHGAERLFSIIANEDVEITIRYEMIDTGTGIAQGTTAHGVGGDGSSVLSNRFVLQQTYEIRNISGGVLSNVHLYQFLHGLNTGIALQDNRDYGGPLSEYHFDSTQQGTVRGFHSETGEIISHQDTVAMHAKMAPAEFEVGYYGREAQDSPDNHIEGKPSVGVHFSVEAHTLDGTDFFSPPEGRWVSGAMCFDLATLAPNASVSVDVLLSVGTQSELLAPPVEIDILASSGMNAETSEFIIDFEERTDAPVDGFILRRSINNHPGDVFPDDWEQVLIPRLINFPHEGASRFAIPQDPNAIRQFYIIEAVINP